MSRPILQLFKVNPDGTTSELTTEGPIKDILNSDESYVLISDELRKVFLWKGNRSSVRSKFIGAKRSQDIRGQVGMHFSVVPLDEGEEDNDFIQIIGGKTEGALAQGIQQEAAATFAPSETKTPASPPRQNKSIPSAPNNTSARTVENIGPLYTGKESMETYMADEPQINFDQIMKKLEEIPIPYGYERELIIIGNQAYSVVEKVQTFLGEKKVEKVIERVGSIPEGVFFARDYSPRMLTESGKIIAIEFLKRMGVGASPSEPKSKKDVLKNQISKQLLGKK